MKKNHPLISAIYSDEHFMASLAFSKRKIEEQGLLEKFEQETDKYLRSFVEFYDIALENPLSTKEARKKLSAGDLLKDKLNLDSVQRKLVEVTSPIRIEEARETYRDMGDDFAYRISAFCTNVFTILRESLDNIEHRKLQQEQLGVKSILKSSLKTKEGNPKSLSWADRMDDSRTTGSNSSLGKD